MTPSELETLAKSIEILSKVVGTIGFPVVVSLYLLLGLPKHLEKINQSNRESHELVIKAIDGLRSDVRELSELLKYTERFRWFAQHFDRGEGDPK